MRDILIKEIPLIFRKEIYALASIMGGMCYYACIHLGINLHVTQIMSAASIILIRIIAVKFKISLPLIKGEKKK